MKPKRYTFRKALSSVRTGNKNTPPPGYVTVDASIYIIDTELRFGDKVVRTKLDCKTMTRQIMGIVNDILSPAKVRINVKRCQTIPPSENSGGYAAEDMFAVETMFDKERLMDPDAIDIFVVPLIPNNIMGYAVNPEMGAATSYIVMSEYDPSWKKYNNTTFASTLAHEICHDLGILKHSSGPSDLMAATATPGTLLTASQRKTIFEWAKKKYGAAVKNRMSRMKTIRHIGKQSVSVDKH